MSSTKRIGDYEILEELTTSPNAAVYRVRSPKGDILVAKVVNNDASGEHELAMHKMIEPIDPQHIVRLLSHFTKKYDLILILENFSKSLSCFGERKAQPITLLSMALDSARGLEEMDRVGIISDDIKLDNIVYKAESSRIAHIDLGSARQKNESCVGYTPLYGAPELKAGLTSDTTSVYGWALAIEEFVSGRVGLSARGARLSEFYPWVGITLSDLLIRCAARAPNQRPSPPELLRHVIEWCAKRMRCSSCNTHILDQGVCFHGCE